MGNLFKAFLENLLIKQPDAWKRLFKVSKNIIEHVAEENMLELDWTSISSTGPAKFDQWFIDFFNDFKKDFEKYSHQIECFEDLKKILTNSATKRLNELFSEFCKGLVLKNEKAWQILHYSLQKRMLFWMIRKNRIKEEDARYIYQEGFSLFYEKIISDTLSFESSRNLKSYLIRIFENKIKELTRMKQKQSNYLGLDRIPGIDVIYLKQSYNHSFDEETLLMIQEQIRKLDKTEQVILIDSLCHNIKLRSIAKNLGISQENCRVIKFRAIHKLRKSLKKII
jgi:RNA polymerase sigma factor (sigma-70 family)